MDWIQFSIFFIGVFGLFLWNRAESRADQRHTEDKIESIRALAYAMIQESKDFHGRLERQDAEFKAHILEERGRK